MKKALPVLFLMVLILGIFISLYAEKTYEGLIGPTETRYWDEANAYNGYTLFQAKGLSYLVDMEGYLINSWPVSTNPRFLDNGNLMDFTPGDVAGFIELDWEGNTVWEHIEDRIGYDAHHDFVRIFNKELNDYTTIYIANKSFTYEQAVAAGYDTTNGPAVRASMDAIVEVDMSGNVVWEWWFMDHLVQDFDSTKNNYVGGGKTIADYPNRLNINLPGKPLKRDWLHCNSLDYNPELGHIAINSVHGEFYIIDHDNTFIPGDPFNSIKVAASSLGDFIYRFGDPARYAQGDPPSILADWTTATTGHKQIGGSHDIQWIKPGLPGEGHLLVFNNGQYLFERTPQSYIFEINPYLNADSIDTGNYVNPPDAGYWLWKHPKDTHKLVKNMSNQITWIYYSQSNQSFFSHIGSGAQRLPNGNTLICSMTEGHFFEVNTAGELFWEYICPVTEDGPVKILEDALPMTNATFRAYRYTADHPALAGRDLTPQTTITGAEPDYLTPEDLTSALAIAKNKTFVLDQNYPNPFNPSTNIPYQLITPGQVKLTIYNLQGQQVKSLVNEHRRSGTYRISWDGTDEFQKSVSSGVYVYRLEIGDKIQSRKMILVR